MPGRNLRRRKFLQCGASAAVAVTAPSCSRDQNPWRTLTPGQARTLEAVCEQIVPEDRDPGAKSAGVTHFIDRQLAGHYRPLQPVYREGLALIDQRSIKQFGTGFSDLPFDRQTEILRALEKDKDGRPFLDAVVAHTMQGFYGSPRHGGNRDAVSWRMLGVPEPPVRGRARYDLTVARPRRETPED